MVFSGTLIIGISFFFIGSSLSKPLDHFEEYMAAQKDYRDRETLSFGDKCLWVDEELRFKTMESVHSIFLNMTKDEDFKTLASEFRKISVPTQAFCKEDDNLQCIEATGKCGCEETKKYQPYLNSTTVQKDSKCFYAEGSSCMEKDYKKQSICEPGTKCQLLSSKEPCNESNVFAGILATKKDLTNELELFKVGTIAAFSGFCKCMKV